MLHLINYLRRHSRVPLMIFGFLLVGAIGLLDYFSGPELSVSVFYLLPVALVAWLRGKWPGYCISLASMGCWLAADLLSGADYSHPLIPYWNAMVGLASFIIITQILAPLRAMQEAQEQMNHFIVHDLRSPMTNIMTGLETLEQINEEALDATSKEIIGMALTSSNRMLTMITALLDTARLSSGSMPVHRQQINVKELVDGSLSQVSMWAGQNEVKLKPEVATTVPKHLLADRELTTRVLINVLGNAIKYSPPQSSITVRVAPHDVAEVAFSVIDQGPGVPKEWADKVFDKFAQVEARKAGAPVGTGLGLAFCRQAIEAQGGRIWLESEVGNGTTVTFTIPVSVS